jgi:hypothetical protein
MNSDKIRWCLCQKNGISLTEPKPHLANSYVNEADDTLMNVSTATGKWKTITAYYACYSALYALLMRCGIRCEIHECTLELMDLFPFHDTEKDFMRQLKDNRIQAQYYLKKILLNDEVPVKQFILRCKVLLSGLSTPKIEMIRSIIRSSVPHMSTQ